MSLIALLALPAYAEPLTAKPAKWETMPVVCSAQMATGSATRANFESELPGGYSGLAALQGAAGFDAPGHSTWWKSQWFVEKQGKGKVAVGPYVGMPSALDDELGKEYKSRHPLILQLDLQVKGPALLVDESGHFLGLAEWDAQAAVGPEIERFKAVGVPESDIPYWTQMVQAFWNPDIASASLRSVWNAHVEGWLGVEPGGAPRTTEEAMPNGMKLRREWVAAESTVCGPAVKKCAELVVVETIADPVGTTAALRAAGQQIPDGAQVYMRNRTTTWVDPTTMQVHGWRVQRAGGGLNAQGHVEVEATDVGCTPPKQ